jgi:hypothetical protein
VSFIVVMSTALPAAVDCTVASLPVESIVVFNVEIDVCRSTWPFRMTLPALPTPPSVESPAQA